jgi:hypothetical protein
MCARLRGDVENRVLPVVDVAGLGHLHGKTKAMEVQTVPKHPWSNSGLGWRNRWRSEKEWTACVGLVGCS